MKIIKKVLSITCVLLKMIGYVLLTSEMFKDDQSVVLMRNLLNPLKQIFDRVYIYSADDQLRSREAEIFYSIPPFDGRARMLVVPLHFKNKTDLFKRDQTSTVLFNHVVYVDIDDQFVINDKDFEIIYNLNERFLTRLKASVLVFDLDDTLIDGEGNIFAEDLNEAITRLRSIYTYVGIWSHGSTNHVFKHIKKISNEYNVKFDFVITRDDKVYNKSAIHILNVLNTKFSISELTFSCLVDDKIENYNNDYSLFLHLTKKPKKFTDMSEIILKNTKSYLFRKSNLNY